MDMYTENDITPQVATMLRKKSGLTQKEFWESVGSNQSSGHWFENGKRQKIPKPMRIVIFLGFVARLPFDVTTKEKAAKVCKFGAEIAARIEADVAQQHANEAARIAKQAAEKAKKIAA